MRPRLHALVVGAVLLLAGGAAPPRHWDPGDPDKAFQIGAWTVRCSRDGDLHGNYEEGCGAWIMLNGVEAHVSRTPHIVLVFAEARGCDAAVSVEMPAARFSRGVSDRATLLRTTVATVLTQKRKLCGKVVKSNIRGLEVSDLSHFLDQSDDLQDFRQPEGP